MGNCTGICGNGGADATIVSKQQQKEEEEKIEEGIIFSDS
jgi:hypothetical protein